MEFKNIYEQHKRMVFNVALHYVWKREDAEEVTQDVFIKVFEGLNQFRSESQLRTWIYRITVNTAIDFLKAKQRQKRGGGWRQLFMDAPNWNDSVLFPFAHPGFDGEQQEQVEQIMRWVFELPKQQREAIVLTKLQGMSVQEAAECMGITTKAVENFLYRAKKHIQGKITLHK